MSKRTLGIFLWIGFGLVVLYLLFRSRSVQAMVPANTGTKKLKNAKDDWANFAGTVVSGGFGLIDTLIKHPLRWGCRSEWRSAPLYPASAR